MSEDIPSSLLYSTLLDIKEDLGSLKAASDARNEKLDAHIALTTAIAERTTGRVDSLEKTRARQKGFQAAMSVVGSVVGAAAGYAAEILHRGK